jgi:hypothetical protein
VHTSLSGESLFSTLRSASEPCGPTTSLFTSSGESPASSVPSIDTTCPPPRVSAPRHPARACITLAPAARGGACLVAHCEIALQLRNASVLKPYDV